MPARAILLGALVALTACGAQVPRTLRLVSGGSGQSSQSDSGSGQSSDRSSQGGGGAGGSTMIGNMGEAADEGQKTQRSESGPTTQEGESHSDSGSDDDVASASVVLLSLLSLATVMLIIYLGVVSTREVSGGAPAQPAPSPAELQRLEGRARDYLLAHRRSLRASLARGDGPFVQELAGALDLPSALRPRLGRALQAHHTELDAWLAGVDAPSLPGPALAGFGRGLFAAIETDPALAPYLRRHQAVVLAAR